MKTNAWNRLVTLHKLSTAYGSATSPPAFMPKESSAGQSPKYSRLPYSSRVLVVVAGIPVEVSPISRMDVAGGYLPYHSPRPQKYIGIPEYKRRPSVCEPLVQPITNYCSAVSSKSEPQGLLAKPSPSARLPSHNPPTS